MCATVGLQCGGYQKNIFFLGDDVPGVGSIRFRRPLLTEEERERMSEWLTSAVPPKLALWNIAQIDDECDEAPTSHSVQITRGPFGAFRITPTQTESESEPEPEPDHEPEPEPEIEIEIEPEPVRDSFLHWQGETDSFDIDTSSQDFFLPSESALTPRTQQLIETAFEPPDQDSYYPTMDFRDRAMEGSHVRELFGDFDIGISEFQQQPVSPLCVNFVLDSPRQQQIARLRSLTPPSIPQSIDYSVPNDAVVLLKHYSTTVLQLLTPFRHSKTPWHILFIPHAKNCLAALTLGEQMDHASLCVFYGILSIAAFSLGGVSRSSRWLDQGKIYKQRAREHVRLMLMTAYEVPKVAKYKSILMALLTMIQAAMISGNKDQTECYFLEAEKFIRVKGLNRKKSRKVRLLHHCYAFDRMFHESTFLSGINSNHRHHVMKAIESSGAAAYSQDSLTFSLSDWSNLDEDMLTLKDQTVGENDLHLQLPGVWTATLYSEIFGVPEIYIFLLSLIIRLGKEKDSENRHEAKVFLTRAKAVERCIKQLRRPRQPTDTPYTKHPSSQVELDNLVDGMQHALSIYFYRRIYDVDASMLQDKVVGVRDCLLRHEFAGSDGASRLIWPAFIAACESEDPEIQIFFTKWFKNAADRYGLQLFSDTLAYIEQLWEEKRRGDECHVTWMNFMPRSAPFVESF